MHRWCAFQVKNIIFFVSHAFCGLWSIPMTNESLLVMLMWSETKNIRSSNIRLKICVKWAKGKCTPRCRMETVATFLVVATHQVC
jgi:hypothetical protein